MRAWVIPVVTELGAARYNSEYAPPKPTMQFGRHVYLFTDTSDLLQAQLSDVLGSREEGELTLLHRRSSEYPIFRQDPVTYRVEQSGFVEPKEFEAPRAQFRRLLLQTRRV